MKLTEQLIIDLYNVNIKRYKKMSEIELSHIESKRHVNCGTTQGKKKELLNDTEVAHDYCKVLRSAHHYKTF